jgi:REP element-mobilizing transposase RayT
MIDALHNGCRDAKFCVSTTTSKSVPIGRNAFGPQSRNLASIIRGYKAGVKKWAKINNIQFAWQERFYDHIIRNETDLDRIREYIANNPSNWAYDEENIKIRTTMPNSSGPDPDLT